MISALLNLGYDSAPPKKAVERAAEATARAQILRRCCAPRCSN